MFPEYFCEPEDLRALARSVRRMRKMMCERAIRELIEAELGPGPIANEQAAIEEDIRDHWVQGLRVADASIMPAALNACTHAPTIMIGEKAAGMIADDSR
jgi:choline dehydrogenase